MLQLFCDITRLREVQRHIVVQIAQYLIGQALEQKADCESRNEFVAKAVNFYADYLAGLENGVLPTAVQSAIDGRLGC